MQGVYIWTLVALFPRSCLNYSIMGFKPDAMIAGGSCNHRCKRWEKKIKNHGFLQELGNWPQKLFFAAENHQFLIRAWSMVLTTKTTIKSQIMIKLGILGFQGFLIFAAIFLLLPNPNLTHFFSQLDLDLFVKIKN